jgi:CrcB protein
MPTKPTLRWLFVRLPVDPDAPSSRADPPLPTALAVLLVAVGGVAGSLGRAAIGRAIPHPSAGWPWSTIVVNVVGSALLALLLVTLLERFPSARIPRPLIGTGLIGGFTTFSTFSVDVVQLAHAGRPALAGLYIAVTLAGTALAAVTGVLLARAVDRLGDQERWARRVHHARSLSPGANES